METLMNGTVSRNTELVSELCFLRLPSSLIWRESCCSCDSNGPCYASCSWNCFPAISRSLCNVGNLPYMRVSMSSAAICIVMPAHLSQFVADDIGSKSGTMHVALPPHEGANDISLPTLRSQQASLWALKLNLGRR